MITIQVEFAETAISASVDEEAMLSWATAALESNYDSAEVCIRVVDETEMSELNGRYRQKSQPTNVLSFPAEIPEVVDSSLLGDIAICAPVVEREAMEQGKSAPAHWAHMVVHGCLHLAGYDHIDDAEAEDMEALEIQILKALGFPNPYHYTKQESSILETADLG